MGDADNFPYTIESQWHSKERQLKVVCIGAGATGLLAAYKLKKEFQNYELAIYDKNADIGGTWHENRYPGCACDVPAHIYTYSFEPNPNWSQFYAGSAEIKQYFSDFADKFDIRKYVTLNTRVLSAIWSEAEGLYQLTLESAGKITSDWCHVLINGTGVLNQWKWPMIKGLHDFEGPIIHSACWDDNVVLNGKTVAVIGTGSSAIQIIPKMQPKVKQLVCFMRSTTWISPPFLDDTLQQTRAGSDHVTLTSQSRHVFTEKEKKKFQSDSENLLEYRKDLEVKLNGMFEVFLRDSPASRQAQENIRAEMLRRIGPGNEDLKQRLIPSWPPGCRRITPGTGYLEALVEDNVTRVHEGIDYIAKDGLFDTNGNLHKVDVIICATGFDVSFKPSFKITGVDGCDMAEEFEPNPYVYLGMSVPKFPNYFTVNGVRGSWTAGTALNSIEACLSYILACAKRIQRENIRALEVKMEPIKDLYVHVDEWHKGSVWSADCRSWYKNNIPGGKVWAWGGSALHYMKSLEFVRWEHYNFRYNAQNMWTFLGNGQVQAEITKDKDGLSPYIRNADEPWHID